MATITPSQVVVYGNTVVAMSRVVDVDHSNIVIGGVYSVGVIVRRRSDGEEIVNESPDPGDAFFDTLQTDYGWSADTSGYNFRYIINGTLLRESEKTFDVFVTAVNTDGEAIAWQYEFSTGKR